LWSAVLVAMLATLPACTRGDGEVEGSNYTDPAGWSVEVPEGWHTLHFETSKAGASSSGTQISNVELPLSKIEPGLPIQVIGLALPEQGVGVIVVTDEDPENVQLPPAEMPTPPLSLSDFNEGSATGGGPVFSFLWFDANGQPLIVTIKRGAGTTSEDQKALEDLIRSLRLQD